LTVTEEVRLLFIPNSKIDIYHITGDIYFSALFTPRSKTVITVHDIDHYEYTLKGLRKFVYGLIWFRIPLFYVKYITTVSNHTKSRIVECFNINPDKIKVIYNPLSEKIPSNVVLNNNVKPIILQIGSGYNKNIENLIHAVNRIECKLIFISKLNENILSILNHYKIDYEQYYNISFEKVIELYKICDVVYFASIYEGFGLPIIEAQKIGRPVLTSNCSSMPEIAGVGSCLVNPFSVDEIRKKIEILLNDKDYYNNKVLNGFRNISRFYPKIIADEYFKIYQHIKNA
jgi:glycosyltransferase involved in cell wall biosynthesis